MTNDFKEIEKVSNEIVALYPLIEKDYDEYVRQTGDKSYIFDKKGIIF